MTSLRLLKSASGLRRDDEQKKSRSVWSGFLEP